MCICINCEFYKNCWIKRGIGKIPKNYLNVPLNLSGYQTNELNAYQKHNISIKVILNNFVLKQKYEFDVIECEGFCEQPGTWVNIEF